MTMYQIDYKGKNNTISTKHDCAGFNQLRQWLNEEFVKEFAEELNGETIDETRLSITAFFELAPYYDCDPYHELNYDDELCEEGI